MKLLIVLTAIVALTAAAPQRKEEQNYNNYQAENRRPIEDFRPRVEIDTTTQIPIIHFDKEQDTNGNYRTSYETGNQIIANESGYLKTVGEKDEEVSALVQEGSYSYIAPDGQVIKVDYIADEKGFRVTGDHIPTPPPVSAEIQKGLDLIYAGIRANQERNELEARNNPEAAKDQQEKAALNYKGLYYPS